MKITYIQHSAFLVELEDIVLLFDYFKGSIPTFEKEKPLFVFSSHSHHDHFNPDIFQLVNQYDHVHFILSEDIKSQLADPDNENYIKLTDKITYIDKNQSIHYKIDDVGNIVSNNINEVNDNTLSIETLESTDLGVAFILSYKGKSIYHAGDLNWWSWEGETQAEYIDMTQRFKREIEKIKGRHFDVSFVPLDPRQEGRFWWGFDHFMRETDTTKVFPMHLWEKYGTIDKLNSVERASGYIDKVIHVTKPSEVFEF